MKIVLIILFTALNIVSFGQTDNLQTFTRVEFYLIVENKDINEAQFLHQLPKKFWLKYSLNKTDSLDRKQGYWFEYYSNGNIRIITHYKNDMLDGKYFAYFESGELESEVFCHQNKIIWVKNYCITGIEAAYGEMDEKLNESYGIKYWDCENNIKIEPPKEIGTRKLN